jgi:hemerythrin-like metal-binding protein
MATHTALGLLRWGNHYVLGVPEIDRDHAALMELVNRLNTEFRSGASANVLRGTLQTIVADTKAHFRMEERIMKKSDYPHRDSHRAEHAFLLNQLIEFQEEFDAGRAELTDSMMTYLKDWLRNHLLIADKRLGRFLRPAMLRRKLG